MTASFEERFQKHKENPPSFEDRFNKLSMSKDESVQSSAGTSFEDRFNGLANSTKPAITEPSRSQFKEMFEPLIPKPYGKKPVYAEEKTPEELQQMSVSDRLQYAKDLTTERELRQSKGFTKGALSGLTLSASEHIPGLKPDEEDLMVGLGETIGSYLPIAKLYNFIGKPLVNLAAKSPVARQGLESLARMTGFGLTGAGYKAGKEVVQGEVPKPEELLKEGATWAGIDAALQSLGLGVAFSQSVKRIAQQEGITAKEVLGKLWDSTKNYAKLKLGRPVKGEILPEDVEVLMEKAKAAETGGLREAEIEVAPQEKIVKPAEKYASPEAKSNEQIDLDLTQTKNKLAELEKTQGKGATSAKSLLIQEINNLELEKYNRSKQQQKQELKPEITEKPAPKMALPENSVLTKPDNISIGLRAGKGVATLPIKETGEGGKEYYSHKEIPVTKEEQELIDASNAWDTAGDQKESSQLADQARQMIFNRLKEQNVPPKEDFPKNEPQFTESGIQKYFPAGTVGDYVKDSEVRKALKDVLEYPVRFAHKDLVPGGLYIKNKPITISKDYDNPEGDYRANEAVLHEAIHALQDRKGRLPVKFTYGKNQPYEERPEEISAKKFTDWAGVKERDFREKLEKAERLAEYEKLDREAEEALASKPAAKKQTQVPPRKTRPLQPVIGKKQAVARSKIIDVFRKAFKDPIRLGKISQRNAAGIHKLWPKMTRLLKDNDVETAAHEIGHNLHTTLYGGSAKTPKEQSNNIEAALSPYLNELKPLAHYEPYGMEGFAEFTRLYVTNPEVARELAPNFYTKFEADLGAQYPEMKNALLEARDYYDQYLQGTPQSRIRAQTSYGSDKGKLASIIDSLKEGFNLDKLKTQFLDDVYPAKRLVAEAFGIPVSEVENLKDERNLYRSLRVLKGAVGKGDVFTLHETFNAKTLDKINGSLKDILKQLPNEESYREFNDYLIARRALEKTAQNVETGINAGDALIAEQELRQKYGKLAQELDKYNDSLLNYAKDSGLLSPEQYKMIKKNNVLYVPFQRVMEPEKGGAASGAGRVQAGKPIKRMKGSTRDIIAPIESVIKNTYSIIINSEKNLSGQVLAKIAQMKNMGAYVEHVPTPIKLKGKVEGEQVAKELAKRFEREGLSDLIEYDQNGKPILREDISDAIPEVFLRFGTGQYPAGENIVTVYFEGKPRYYEVSPEIFEMWTKGIAPYTANLLTKILRIPSRTLRAGAILNPRFMQKNAIRDTWGGWLFTKYGKSIKDPTGMFIDTIYSPLAMLSVAAKKGPLYVEWLKSGGGMSTMQSLDRDAVVKKLEEVRNGYKPYQVVKWLRQTAEISEEANRLSEFGRALNVEGKTRLGREISAFASRDLSVDFAKMGLQVKALNQIIPFFNATIQGGDKFLRAIVNPKDRKDFLPRVLGFIVLPSLMLAWLNKDDERVKEFYEEEKDFNFITFVGDQAIKIPVPFETGVLAHGLTQRMFNYYMKKDPEAFEQFMGSIMSAMMPNFIPAFANPFIETWANKSFFTNARIIPAGKEDLLSRYQYKNNSSSTARLLGRAMTYMIGQDTRSKAASPAIIDHFINSWGGGLGRLMINISDASLEAAGLSDKIPGPDQTITEKLGLDAFTARFPRASTRSIEKFYDNYADAMSRAKSLKFAEKMDLETEEGIEEAYKRFEKIYDYNSLQSAYKAMQACQKEINNIWNDPSIDSNSKKQMINDLYMDMIEFAKAANEDIRQYRLTQKD